MYQKYESSDVFERITNMVCQLLRIPEEQKPGPHADLWNLGLTSITAIQLVVDVQRTFGLELTDEDMNHQNLATINSIASTAMMRMGKAHCNR